MVDLIFEEKLKIEVEKFCHKQNIFDEQQISFFQNDILQKVKNKQYDFSNFRKQVLTTKKGGKKRKRLLCKYKKPDELFSVEEVLLKTIEQTIKQGLHFRTRGRKQIVRKMLRVFDELNSLENFTIFCFDFKNFYESISNQFVYEKYLKKVNFCDSEQQILEEYVSIFPHCMQGICLSNLFAEIVAHDLDGQIKKKFKKFELMHYLRLMDDGLVILSEDGSKEMCFAIVQECVEKLNEKSKNCMFPNKLKLNEEKFKFLSSKEKARREFAFLRYNFVFSEKNEVAFDKKIK